MSSRAPIVSSRSQFCSAKLAARLAMPPGMPTSSGSDAGTRSAPRRVVRTGTPSRRTSAATRSLAPAMRTPLPTSSSGRVDAASDATTASICESVARATMRACASGSKPSSPAGSISAACTSSGMSIHTGPGRPVRARNSAWSRCQRIVVGSRIVTAYFVIGCTIETMSISWTPRWRSGVAERQVRALRLAGHEQARRRVEPGRGDAGHRVRRTGTGREHRHAEAVADPRIRFGRDRRRLFVQRRHRLDRFALAERVVQVHRAAAGQHEHVLHAFRGDAAHHVIRQLHSSSPEATASRSSESTISRTAPRPPG